MSKRTQSKFLGFVELLLRIRNAEWRTVVISMVIGCRVARQLSFTAREALYLSVRVVR